MKASKLVRVLGATASALVLVTLVTVGQHARATQAPDVLIRGPVDWVPLTFELTHSEDGVLLSMYVTYRSANGSMRRERNDGQTIEVLNLATDEYYQLHAGTWYEHPARPQPAAGKPFLVLDPKTAVEVPASDPRVRALAGLGMALTFYEVGRGTPAVKVFCPELNLLEVWAQRRRGGKLAEFKVTSVSLGEPGVQFLPPSGVQPVRRNDPAGPGRVTGTPSGLGLRNGKVSRGQNEP